MWNQDTELWNALAELAPEIARADSPYQYVQAVIHEVVEPYRERADREAKLACKLAQYLFDKGDQYHSRLQWNGSEWIEFPMEPCTDEVSSGVE